MQNGAERVGANKELSEEKSRMGVKLNFKISSFTFRRRVIIIAIGFALVSLSLLFTSDMTRQLREKEKYEVSLWTHALERTWQMNINDPLFQRILSGHNNVPFLIVNDNLVVLASNLISEHVINHPDLLLKEIDKLNKINQPIKITAFHDSMFYVFYGESRLLKSLKYFPIIQLFAIAVFFVFGYITLRSSKHDEQNSVWIGLAKETAHQLGTPTSSLLGWLEYLRTQPVDQLAVDEMDKDISRLLKVVDRFSKIGSETSLSPTNINESVGESVLYYRSRSPKNVTIEYNGLAIAPLYAMANLALFEWVVENLLKNALDALQGKGVIKVTLSSSEEMVFIDVMDTGKGIPKANFKRIFEPGFTTKTRGWGLGLSLSRRIIATFHHGKIAVVESEVGRGTTIRVSLKRDYTQSEG